MRKLFAWDRALALLACLAGIALVAASAEPAMNTGDYGRVTRSFGLDFALNVVPQRCPAFDGGRPIPPLSPLALLGMAQAGAARMAGLDCFPMPAWFALLSAIFWSGVLAHARRLRGRGLAALCAGSLTAYELFAPLLYSFYEEALFAALLPWLAFVRFGPPWRTALSLAIVFAALVAKAQALFFLPILLALFWRRGTRPTRWQIAALALVVLTGAGLNLVKSHHYSYMNSYNRIYNGLGWAALDVASWPAREYFGRRDAFYGTLARGKLSRAPQCALGGTRLLGTAYWPTGAAVRAGEVPASPEAREKVGRLGLADFVRCAREIGRPVTLVGQVYAVFLGSDYRLSYLRGRKEAGDGLTGLRDLLLRWAGPACIVAALGLGAMLRSRFFALAAAYILLASPLFVVLGDGFYEFEKHMHLNFMMFAGCAFVAGWRRATAGRAGPGSSPSPA